MSFNKTSVSNQLAASLEKMIRQGRWATGSQLPPLRALASQFNVSVNSVQAAQQALVEQGLVERRARMGVFIKDHPRQGSAGKRLIGVIRPSETLQAEGDVQGQIDLDCNTWIYQIVRAAESQLLGPDYHLATLSFPADSRDPMASLQVQIERLGDDLAGVFGAACPGLVPLWAQLASRKIPWVSINLPQPGSVYNFVAADNQAGGRQLGSCLAATGVDRVLVLTTALGQRESIEDRIMGVYQSYLRAQRSTQGIEVVVCKDVEEQSGYQVTLEYLNRKGPRPQVIFALGDKLALGAIRACREANVSVPDEVGVVGGTGLELAQYSHPSLTTLNQPMEMIGQHVAEMLLEMIRGGMCQMLGRRILSTLTWRESFCVPSEIRLSLEQQCREQTHKPNTLSAFTSAPRSAAHPTPSGGL